MRTERIGIMVARTSRVLFVQEVELELADRPTWLRVTTSIPGREGTLNKVWSMPSGTLSDDEYRDLLNWMAQQTLMALQTVGGIQMTFPV
jgi:hypothetical protein